MARVVGGLRSRGERNWTVYACTRTRTRTRTRTAHADTHHTRERGACLCTMNARGRVSYVHLLSCYILTHRAAHNPPPPRAPHDLM